jgi:hypothetical protein
MPERPYFVRARPLPRLVFAAGCLLPILSAPAAEAKVTIEPAAKWSNVFGGKDVDVPFVVRGAEGQVTASLAIGPRHVSVVVGADPKKPGHFVVKLRSPDVNPGVILKMVLTVTAHSDKDVPLASYNKVLWVFPSDPFVDRSKWLESLKVTLFDPAETTGPLLKKNGIPFKETVNVAELAGKAEGLVLVGAGVSFSDYPDLWETLRKLAARGVPVLCLAPAAGELPLPGVDAEGITVRGTGVIRRLDKRLDAAGWAPDGKVAVSGVSLTGDERHAQAVVGKDGDWPFFEIDYPAADGKLVVCGFDFLGKWDAGPTPRYLFARLLEYLTEKNEPEAMKERSDAR